MRESKGNARENLFNIKNLLLLDENHCRYHGKGLKLGMFGLFSRCSYDSSQ